MIADGEGSELRYFEKAPAKKEYVVLSQAAVDDPDSLKALLELSIGYVADY